MRLEQIDRIVEGVTGVRKDEAALLVPEDSELSLYLALGSEVLTIARVSRIERSGDLCVVDTHGGDRYYVAADNIAVVKSAGAGRRNAKGGAGFR